MPVRLEVALESSLEPNRLLMGTTSWPTATGHGIRFKLRLLVGFANFVDQFVQVYKKDGG